MQFVRKHRNKIYVRSIFSICLVISAALLVLAVAGSLWVTYAVSSYAAQAYEENLKSVVRMFDGEMERIASMASQMSGTSWVRRIMLMQGADIDRTRVSDFSLIEHLQELRTLKQTNSLIDEIGILFFEKDLVVASYGKGSFDFLARNAVRVEGMTGPDWLALGECMTLASPYRLPDVAVGKYGGRTRGSLFVYPLQDGATSSVRAALFVVVQHQSIGQFLRMQILSAGGMPSSLSIAADAAGEPFLWIGTLPEGNTTRAQAQSVQSSWLFTMTTPQSIVISEAISLRNALLLVVAGIGLLTMLASVLVTRRFFAPIERLARMVSPDEERRQQDLNEYDALRQGIELLHEQRSRLKAELLQRQPMARNAAFHMLLSQESMQQESLDRIIGVLDVRRAWQAYCVCQMMPMQSDAQPVEQVFDSLGGAVSGSGEDAQAVCGMLRGEPAALLCGQSMGVLQALVVRILEALPDHRLILGDIVHSQAELPFAFRSAAIARDYRLVSEGFRVLRYDEALLSKGGYYLPREMEYKLMQAIRGGSLPQAQALLMQLYQHNASQNQATYASLRNLLFNLHLDVAKLLREEDLQERGDDQWNDEASVETLYDELRRGVARLCEHHRARIQATPARLEDMVGYVRTNLSNCMLSLTMVADAFGVSGSLVSRLFSEQQGENFLSFVNRARIENACALLRTNPSMDILAVANAVGYENDVTFRRLFKKYVGMTPSAYREQRPSGME